MSLYNKLEMTLKLNLIWRCDEWRARKAPCAGFEAENESLRRSLIRHTADDDDDLKSMLRAARHFARLTYITLHNCELLLRNPMRWVHLCTFVFNVIFIFIFMCIFTFHAENEQRRRRWRKQPQHAKTRSCNHLFRFLSLPFHSPSITYHSDGKMSFAVLFMRYRGEIPEKSIQNFI